MVKGGEGKDKEPKNDESSKPSEQDEETSETGEKSNNDETSDVNPNEEQPEVESGDNTEENLPESSTVDDSEPESGTTDGKDSKSASGKNETESNPETSQTAENHSPKKTVGQKFKALFIKPCTGPEKVKDTEPTNAEGSESAGAKESEPAGAEESEPADAEGSEPADAEESEPAGAEESEQAGAEESEQAGAENSEPADAEESEAGDNQEASESEPPASGVEKEEDKEYTFDEMVDMAGYGNFQRMLTFLGGLGWMADAFEIRVLAMLSDYIACDWTVYRWHSAALTSTVFIGMMLGAPCFGIIADRFGRRKSLAIALLLLFICGASSAISQNIGTLLAMRLLTGFVFGGATQGFTLCAEYYPTKNRGVAGFYLKYYWATGTVLLILLTWLVMTYTNNWHLLIVGAAFPSLIVFFSMNWFPESVRWYLVSGKYEKAVEQVSQMLRMNKSDLKPTQLKKIPDDELEEQGNIVHLMRSPHTKTTLLLWYIAFATSFHYYGITIVAPYIISEGKLMVPANEADMKPVLNYSSPATFFTARVKCRQVNHAAYIDLVWHSCAEFPGLIVFTLIVRFMERRTLLSVSCMINSFIVLLMLAEAKTPIPTKIVMFFARANCSGFLQLVTIISNESFPTTLRGTGVGSVAAFGKLGAALVPFVAQCLIIEDPIATVCILGAVILVGAGAASYLPRDTKGVPLKDLTEQVRQAERAKKEEEKPV